MSAYIDRALERMRLSIEVLFFEGMTRDEGSFLVETTYVSDQYGVYRSPTEASAAYFALVESLSNPGTSSPTPGRDGCSAISASPGGGR